MPKRCSDASASTTPALHRSVRSRKTKLCCIEDDFDAIASSQLALIEAELSKKPPGPTTWEEVISWPEELIYRLKQCDGHKIKILMDTEQFGSLNTTDYSGFDCPREMVFQMQKVFQALYELDGKIGNILHRFVRSCDVGGLQRRVLLWMSNHLDSGKSCVLQDIEGCLDDWVVQELDDMIPHQQKTDLSVAEKAEVAKAYADMWAWLVKDRQKILPDPLLSPCLTHDGYCPLFAWREECDHSKALRLHWAGTTCTGWSSVGLQEGLSHTSERTHNIWLLQRIVLAERNKEDAFFQDPHLFVNPQYRCCVLSPSYR